MQKLCGAPLQDRGDGVPWALAAVFLLVLRIPGVILPLIWTLGAVALTVWHLTAPYSAPGEFRTPRRSADGVCGNTG
jgi:hypothetical protein